MSKIERTLREKLAASHHVVHYNGWGDLLATHLSVRIPDSDFMLITPHNIPFEEVSASKIVKTDLDGTVIDQCEYTVMPQAINIHASVYKKSSSIVSAMHTHSIYGTAVASLKCGLLFINQHVLQFYGDVAYHNFNGLALDNEGEMIVNSLGDKKVMILRNHGLLTTGNSIEQALYKLFYLERSCEMQIKAMASNSEIVTIPEEVCKKTKNQFDSSQMPELEFDALVRRVKGSSRVDYSS